MFFFFCQGIIKVSISISIDNYFLDKGAIFFPRILRLFLPGVGGGGRVDLYHARVGADQSGVTLAYQLLSMREKCLFNNFYDFLCVQLFFAHWTVL